MSVDFTNFLRNYAISTLCTAYILQITFYQKFCFHGTSRIEPPMVVLSQCENLSIFLPFTFCKAGFKVGFNITVYVRVTVVEKFINFHTVGLFVVGLVVAEAYFDSLAPLQPLKAWRRKESITQSQKHSVEITKIYSHTFFSKIT